MPRKYDRIIRFYDSWFDDLSDPSKELSSDEQLQIIRAIRDAQVMMTSEPIRNLPLQIRRCLSVATLCEQIERMCERSERMRSRGRAGGLAAAQHAALPACDDDDEEDNKNKTFNRPTFGASTSSTFQSTGIRSNMQFQAPSTINRINRFAPKYNMNRSMNEDDDDDDLFNSNSGISSLSARFNK